MSADVEDTAWFGLAELEERLAAIKLEAPPDPGGFRSTARVAAVGLAGSPENATRVPTAGGGVIPPTLPPVPAAGGRSGASADTRPSPAHQVPEVGANRRSWPPAALSPTSATYGGWDGEPTNDRGHAVATRGHPTAPSAHPRRGRLGWLKRAGLVIAGIACAALVLAAAFAIGGGIFLLAAVWWPR